MKWSNKYAISLLKNLIPILGKPTSIAPNKHGLAHWTKDKLKAKLFGERNVFEEHLLRDENVPHKCPRPHNDYFYSYIKVRIHPKKLEDVLSLSGSVTYDPLKMYLSARCASLEANIATLKLATDILLNHKVNVKLGKDQFKYQGIGDIHAYDIYGLTITSMSDKRFAKQMYKGLVKNVSKLNQKSSTKPQGYWKAAFSYEDNQCFPPNKANKICADSQKGKGKGNGKPSKPAKKQTQPRKKRKQSRKKRTQSRKKRTQSRKKQRK